MPAEPPAALMVDHDTADELELTKTDFEELRRARILKPAGIECHGEFEVICQRLWI